MLGGNEGMMGSTVSHLQLMVLEKCDVMWRVKVFP